MKKNETFPWPMDDGAAMDFANGELLLVFKDDEWNENQLESAAKDPLSVLVCENNGLIIFLVEGGPLDTSDLYFNIQDCDEADSLLHLANLPVQALLIDKDNKIQAVKSATLSSAQTHELQSLLEKQKNTDFMPGEFDVNMEGLQSAYEPAELAKFKKMEFELH